MSRVCILTDSTAQFTRKDFPGNERVFVIPLGLEPPPVEKGPPPNRLNPPVIQDFTRFYSTLSKEFDGVLVLVLSERFNPTAEVARKASHLYNNHVAVQVVDSQTTAAGLGMLVEIAAGIANTGASLETVEQQVRAALSHVYMLLCIPELTRLVGLGLLTQTQAVVGEMLGMLPVFMVEDGFLTPLEKVRTPRHLFESFQEYMAEFTAPKRIALLRGTSQITLRTRPLRLYVQENFPDTIYSEHSLNPHLAALFGPQSIGLVVMDPA